jgi:hypothetical protein
MSVARIVTGAVLASVVVASVATPHAVAGAADAAEHRLADRLNASRAEHGLEPLVVSKHLTALARRHSSKMLQQRRMRLPHLSPMFPAHSYLAEVQHGGSVGRLGKKLLAAVGPKLGFPHWRQMGVGVARAGHRLWATLIVADDLEPDPAGTTARPSIAADCSRDVTAEINAWLDALPDGSTAVFRRNGCYRTERTVVVEDGADLTIVGNGATFRRFDLSPPELRYPQANAHWRFVGGRNIRILDLRIQGTNTAPDQRPGFGAYRVEFEFEHGLAFHGVQGVTVEDVMVDAVWGDGLYVAGTDQYDRDPSRNVFVSGLTVDRNGRQGVALCSVDGAVLDNVRILHGRRAGFDLEPPPGEVLNVEIRNSYTNTIGLAFASAGAGDVSHIEIHHNEIDGPSVPWIYVKDSTAERRNDWSVHHNTVLDPLGSPVAMLRFTLVDDVDVRENISHAATSQSRKAVEFSDAGGVLVVANNDFTGACSPYVADPSTGPVDAYGNIVSPASTCP